MLSGIVYAIARIPLGPYRLEGFAPGTTLLGISRLFTDPGYRLRMLKFVRDPLLLAFWNNEYEQYEKRFRNEIIAPVQNKVGAIRLAPVLRNIVGQAKSTVSIEKVMDEGRILVANLSKGKLGEDKASLLGALLVSQFQLAALKRADLPEEERRYFVLYVDEFQNVSTDAFCSILSEARKFRLSLVLGNQFSGQLRPEVRDAVLGNVGSIVAFRTGVDDAELLAREFGNAYQVIAKVLSGGEALEPFRGRTLPPYGDGDSNRAQVLIRVSRERFGQRRTTVEGKVERWLRL